MGLTLDEGEKSTDHPEGVFALCGIYRGAPQGVELGSNDVAARDLSLDLGAEGIAAILKEDVVDDALSGIETEATAAPKHFHTHTHADRQRHPPLRGAESILKLEHQKIQAIPPIHMAPQHAPQVPSTAAALANLTFVRFHSQR